ncbi:MAG: hypothetical protein EHM21_16335, partial [Chloroflexi bacterium]
MDKPTYFEDNYASKFLTGKTVFPDDTRIFHRAEYEYDDVAALGKGCLEGSTFKADLFFRSGAAGTLTIRPARSGILRIQFGRAGASFAETSPMLVDGPASGDGPSSGLSAFQSDAPALECSETTAGYTLRFGDYKVELDTLPFCLRVISPKGETIFESEWEKIVDMYTAPPLGLRLPRGSKDGGAAFLSWRIRNGERIFGLGEKFNKFEKTGTRATIWEADTCGSNTTDMSYKAVPVIFSTAGWALLLHSSFRSFWEIGSFSYATGGMLVEEDKLDLFLI